MISRDSFQSRERSTPLLQTRIAYGVKVARITLCLAGTILTIVQAVKFLTYAPEERNFTSLAIAFALGILLLVLSLPAPINKIVTRFASRIRSRSFATYIFITPIILTIIFILLKMQMDHESWRRVSSEGGISEYGTAIAYLITSVFAYPICRQFRRQKERLLAFAYGLLTFMAFFVGMEEISWGQRLIGFDEPQFWAEHNTQAEFTFHNLSFYQANILNQSFIVLGFIGSFSWIALWLWQKSIKTRKVDLSYILPNWSISSFFYPILSFWMILLYVEGQELIAVYDHEHCEFIMSLGILLFVIINFFRQAREAISTNQNFQDGDRKANPTN